MRFDTYYWSREWPVFSPKLHFKETNLVTVALKIFLLISSFSKQKATVEKCFFEEESFDDKVLALIQKLVLRFSSQYALNPDFGCTLYRSIVIYVEG